MTFRVPACPPACRLSFLIKPGAFLNWIGLRHGASSFDPNDGPGRMAILQYLTGLRLKAKMRAEIEHCLSQAGTDPFQRWLDGLADLRCRVAVLRRVDRMADGNPGDQRFCRDGVWERSANDEN